MPGSALGQNMEKARMGSKSVLAVCKLFLEGIKT